MLRFGNSTGGGKTALWYPPDLCGVLEKQGKRHGNAEPRWNSRFFVLKGSNLFWFASPSAKSPKGHVPLEGASVHLVRQPAFSEATAAALTGPRGTPAVSMFGIVVLLDDAYAAAGGRSELVVAASSPELQALWTKALQQASIPRPQLLAKLHEQSRLADILGINLSKGVPASQTPSLMNGNHNFSGADGQPDAAAHIMPGDSYDPAQFNQGQGQQLQGMDGLEGQMPPPGFEPGTNQRSQMNGPGGEPDFGTLEFSRGPGEEGDDMQYNGGAAGEMQPWGEGGMEGHSGSQPRAFSDTGAPAGEWPAHRESFAFQVAAEDGAGYGQNGGHMTGMRDMGCNTEPGFRGPPQDSFSNSDPMARPANGQQMLSSNRPNRATGPPQLSRMSGPPGSGAYNGYDSFNNGGGYQDGRANGFRGGRGAPMGRSMTPPPRVHDAMMSGFGETDGRNYNDTARGGMGMHEPLPRAKSPLRQRADRVLAGLRSLLPGGRSKVEKSEGGQGQYDLGHYNEPQQYGGWSDRDPQQQQGMRGAQYGGTPAVRQTDRRRTVDLRSAAAEVEGGWMPEGGPGPYQANQYDLPGMGGDERGMAGDGWGMNGPMQGMHGPPQQAYGSAPNSPAASFHARPIPHASGYSTSPRITDSNGGSSMRHMGGHHAPPSPSAMAATVGGALVHGIVGNWAAAGGAPVSSGGSPMGGVEILAQELNGPQSDLCNACRSGMSTPRGPAGHAQCMGPNSPRMGGGNTPMYGTSPAGSMVNGSPPYHPRPTNSPQAPSSPSPGSGFPRSAGPHPSALSHRGTSSPNTAPTSNRSAASPGGANAAGGQAAALPVAALQNVQKQVARASLLLQQHADKLSRGNSVASTAAGAGVAPAAAPSPTMPNPAAAPEERPSTANTRRRANTEWFASVFEELQASLAGVQSTLATLASTPTASPLRTSPGAGMGMGMGASGDVSVAGSVGSVGAAQQHQLLTTLVAVQQQLLALQSQKQALEAEEVANVAGAVAAVSHALGALQHNAPSQATPHNASPTTHHATPTNFASNESGRFSTGPAAEQPLPAVLTMAGSTTDGPASYFASGAGSNGRNEIDGGASGYGHNPAGNIGNGRRDVSMMSIMSSASAMARGGGASILQQHNAGGGGFDESVNTASGWSPDGVRKPSQTPRDSDVVLLVGPGASQVHVADAAGSGLLAAARQQGHQMQQAGSRMGSTQEDMGQGHDQQLEQLPGMPGDANSRMGSMHQGSMQHGSSSRMNSVQLPVMPQLAQSRAGSIRQAASELRNQVALAAAQHQAAMRQQQLSSYASQQSSMSARQQQSPSAVSQADMDARQSQLSSYASQQASVAARQQQLSSALSHADMDARQSQLSSYASQQDMDTRQSQLSSYASQHSPAAARQQESPSALSQQSMDVRQSQLSSYASQDQGPIRQQQLPSTTSQTSTPGYQPSRLQNLTSAASSNLGMPAEQAQTPTRAAPSATWGSEMVGQGDETQSLASRAIPGGSVSPPATGPSPWGEVKAASRRARYSSTDYY